MSEEVAGQLPDQGSELVVETALKINSKRKRKGLAKAIASQAGTKPPQVIAQIQSRSAQKILLF